MMYTVPHHYHESRVTYTGSKLLVKQEPIDLMEINSEPVDMSILTSEPRHSDSPHIHLETESLNRHNVQFHDFYNTYHNRQEVRHTAKQVVRKCTTQGLNHPLNINPAASSPPTSDIEDLQPKDSDRKYVSSETLTNNSGALVFSNADLLLSDIHQRARREFVPDNKKDVSYWCKRLKNNDSARRSRVKRKTLEKIMEARLAELQKENTELKNQVSALRRRYGEEEGSSSDSSLFQEKMSSHSPSLSSPENKQRSEDELKPSDSSVFYSNNNLPVQFSDSVVVPKHSLAIQGRERTDSIESNAYSQTSSRASSSSSPDSWSSQKSSFDTDLPTNVTETLNLQTEYNSRPNSTPTSRLTSPNSFSSDTSCNIRRTNFSSSDSSSQEDNKSVRSMKAFPLKFRWKMEMQAMPMAVTEIAA